MQKRLIKTFNHDYDTLEALLRGHRKHKQAIHNLNKRRNTNLSKHKMFSTTKMFVGDTYQLAIEIWEITE